jgi:ABC-type sugar transport system permease subunit
MTTDSTPEARSQARPPKAEGTELSEGSLSLLLNAPTFVLVGSVLLFPLFYALYLSLSRVRVADLRRGFPFPFYGTENFLRLFQDDLFWLSLGHTVLFAAVVVVVEIALGLAIALLIHDRGVWLARATKFLMLLPYGVPPIANGLVWIYIYNFKLGFLNRVLVTLGLVETNVDWIGNPETTLYMVAVPYVWRTLPFAVLLFHAALQEIPQEYYEAAEVDGAGYWRSFFSITLPLLMPVIAVVVILRTSFAFLVFDEVMALTQGGPGDATWVASWYAYRKAFAPPFDIGLGAASAFVLAILLTLLALAYVKLLYRRTP